MFWGGGAVKQKEDINEGLLGGSSGGINSRGAAGGLGDSTSTDSDAASSFTRKSTFGWVGLGPGGFTRELTFTRGITEALGFDFDAEEAWTQQLINNYVYGEEHGRDGDVPLPAAFAQDAGFWKTCLLSGLLGCFMGVAGTGFMNMVDYVPSVWVANGKFDEASDCDFYAGKLYWLAIPTTAGCLVGLLRHFSSYPDNLPGLFKEINSHHVEPAWAPLTFLISAISLGAGASLGPEQALGNLGGGLATWITQQLPLESADDKKLLVLSGMSAAMGALFPTPMLGVMMIHELGNPPKTYMESIIVMSVGATAAFLVFYAILPYTDVSYFSSNLVLTYNWTFEEWQCGTAILIGIASAVIGLVVILFVGICKQIFVRLRLRLQWNRLLQQVVPPMVGGLLIGLINYCLPLTVGDGSAVLPKVVQYGHNYVKEPATWNGMTPPPTLLPLLPSSSTESISTHLLLCSAFAKMFVLGISMNCGFVGGFVFPTILIGVMAGVVCYQLFTYIPLGMCVSCFLSAVPAGICPMPFTLACLAIFTQYNGLYQTIPVYIATITSYTLVCGSGIFSALQRRGQQNSQTEAQKEAAREEDERDYAVRNYLGNANARKARLGDA